MMTFAVIRSLILLVLKNISLQCNAVSQPPNLDSVNINFFSDLLQPTLEHINIIIMIMNLNQERIKGENISRLITCRKGRE